MGFTSLARWVNAPPTGLQRVRENLILNHNASYRGKWSVSLKSYRSTLGQIPGVVVPIERTMFALTMDENLFIFLEDFAAPTKADVLSAAPPGQEVSYLQNPSHYRNTFVTLRPAGGLEQLLSQTKARWVPVRQTSSGNNIRAQPLAGGQQLTLDGHIFAIGTDWLVRIGNVILASGAVKGMLLEAEYLPLPVLQTPLADGTSDLLSNLLASILPIIKEAKTVAVTISDAQLEDVLWDREEELYNKTEINGNQEAQDKDDPEAWDLDEVKDWKRNDWVGLERDRRMLRLATRRSPCPIESLGYRWQSTAFLFYQNRQLELYASRETKRLTLRQLVYYGRSMNEERLLRSANYVRTELPVRIAHRLRDLQALPYIVVTQEGVGKVHELYWSAFEKIRHYPPITSIKENERFCEFLKGLLNEHAPVIPNLSLGLSLSSPHLPPDNLDTFMRRMLVSRISRRVLAEHHIALSEAYKGCGRKINEEPHVGIIFTGLNVKRSVEYCAQLLRKNPIWLEDGSVDSDLTSWPEIHVDGHVETSFSYIREHLEYIIFELLKNAIHATYMQHQQTASLPSLQVTIVASEHDVGIRISDKGGGLQGPGNPIKNASDLFSFSHVRNAARMDVSRLGALRTASASERGLRGTIDEQVGRWQQAREFYLTKSDAAVQQFLHPRIGIGLPMSYIYARYFGGSLELVSLDGWGTDVYLRLPKLGTNLEGIEV